MKKALLISLLMLLITLPVSAQQYWDLKTSFQGNLVLPADSNGAAYGGALMTTFGAPDGSYEVGFEAAKWWRTFSLHNHFIDSLIQEGRLTRDNDLAEYDQQGLQFSLLARYRFYSLMEEGKLDFFTGMGGGFYFLQEKRQEARQNPATGLWSVEKVDNYLLTKGQSFVMLGLNSRLASKLDMFWENRFTYIFDWELWEDPYAFTTSLGLKYEF
jgi:hypothetical protein